MGCAVDPTQADLSTLCNHSIAVYHSNQQGVGHFGAQFGKEGVDRYNLILAETRVIGLHFCRWQYRSIFFQIFTVNFERRMCFETERIMTLQGHPRSLILAPIESPCMTSYSTSIVTLVLSCRVSEILALLYAKSHPYSGENFGEFPLEQTRHVGVAKWQRPRLTNGEIIVEEFQHLWSQFTSVTDRRTDRQTTCDRNTALCTSRGKKRRDIYNDKVKKTDTVIKAEHQTMVRGLTRWFNNTKILLKNIMLSLQK